MWVEHLEPIFSETAQFMILIFSLESHNGSALIETASSFFGNFFFLKESVDRHVK